MEMDIWRKKQKEWFSQLRNRPRETTQSNVTSTRLVTFVCMDCEEKGRRVYGTLWARFLWSGLYPSQKGIWLGCCAPGSFMTICIRPIPLSCTLRNSAFGLQVRVISRHSMYVGCSNLAQQECKMRHGKVEVRVLWKSSKKYDLECGEKWYEHQHLPAI